MIQIYPYEQLGRANYGWLDARYHFSFAGYYHPKRLGFGVLRVINDDLIQPGMGFDTHGHRDMEIITYVRRGAISHKDNQGNSGCIKAGEVQVMSAGSGIFHSEYNPENVETNLYQIWIEPNRLAVEPRWDTYRFPEKPVTNALSLLVSGDNKAPLYIHQNVYIYAGFLKAGTEIHHSLVQQAYLLVSDGVILVDSNSLKKGDGAEISQQKLIHIKALTDAELLLIDIPEKSD